MLNLTECVTVAASQTKLEMCTTKWPRLWCVSTLGPSGIWERGVQMNYWDALSARTDLCAVRAAQMYLDQRGIQEGISFPSSGLSGDMLERAMVLLSTVGVKPLAGNAGQRQNRQWRQSLPVGDQ